jgi:cytoskeletal protein RodZ
MTNPNLGSYLKDLRLRKGYSIERLSTETKISLTILKKLECNDLATLPNITYIKGYVQNILKTLHVNFGKQEIDLIEKTYLDLGLIKKVEPTPVEPAKQNSTVSQVNTSAKGNIYNLESLKSKRIIFTVVAIIALIGIFRFVQKINQQPDLRQSQVKVAPNVKPIDSLVQATTTISPPVIANSGNIALTPEVPSSQALAIVETTAATPSPTSTIAPTQTPTLIAGNFPKFEFKKITNLAVSIDQNSPENTDTSIYTEEDRKRITTGKENVFVTKLDGESWISYKKNNEAPRSVLLKAGQKFFITGDKIFLNYWKHHLVLKFSTTVRLVQFVDSKGVKSFIFPLS